MPTLDLTLDSFLVPDLVGYNPSFGRKITRTEMNGGGLSTAEVNQNVMMAFAKMRPVPIASASDTTDVEYDAKLVFQSNLASSITLTLGDGTYIGCNVVITNVSSLNQIVSLNSTVGQGRVARTVTLEPKSIVQVVWDGVNWQVVTTKISTVAPSSPTTGDIWVETDTPQNNS